jgi:NAD(P)-dependent dehydrogenase (short-subunit alcohol dehydrogenase family)
MHDFLHGRTALVAGGTGNVGRVIVKAMLDAGATVAVPSRSSVKLEQLRAEAGAGREGRLVCVEGDISDEGETRRLLDQISSRAGPLDAAVASLGRFVPAPSVLASPASGLRRVVDDYLLAHFAVARAVIPILRERGGSYTFINGPLAFRPMFPGTGLVSIVTAAQAVLARVAMTETEDTPVRVNEVVVYTRFGPGDEDARQAAVQQSDVGAYVALLAAERGAAVRGRTIHLDSPEPLRELVSLEPGTSVGGSSWPEPQGRAASD